MINYKYAQRTKQLYSSTIREILKLAEQPNVISFAGGLPNPDAFPIAAIKAATEYVIANHSATALQYGLTEGYTPLRAWIAEWHSRRGAPISPEQVLITTGSQQALDLLGKVFIDIGSLVLVENPTYLGALQAFSLYQPTFVTIPSDDDGLLPASLEAKSHRKARFFYTIPSFQNPTGRVLPLERRLELVKRAQELGLLLIEDDPYGELIYSGTPLPTLRELNPQGVVYLGSFSKILAPGLRLGYIIAEPKLITKLAQAKQAADLHTSTLTQTIVYQTIKDGLLEHHIPSIRKLYAGHCQTMLEALNSHMPPLVQWNRPRGGMFIWLRLPEGMDSTIFLANAMREHIAFVPGKPFYVRNPEIETLRLSFATVPLKKIIEGIGKLAIMVSNLIIPSKQQQSR